jgi:alkylhydroperoxidase/carboxymuconolactone decarboxylase family protein YurZ
VADDDRYKRGAEMIKKVYAGDVTVPPKGAMAFSDLMIESLFAEVWTREELSIRDRRLILLGVIGALGEKDTFAIQTTRWSSCWRTTLVTRAPPACSASSSSRSPPSPATRR